MSGNAMDYDHSSFVIRPGENGTFSGDCGCGHSYADYTDAASMWMDMEQHREEAGA